MPQLQKVTLIDGSHASGSQVNSFSQMGEPPQVKFSQMDEPPQANFSQLDEPPEHQDQMDETPEQVKITIKDESTAIKDES